MSKTCKTFAFIDASNLFYGGEKSLGWKIDYRKLHWYLTNKYHVSKFYYFGGVETYNFVNDYLTYESVPLNKLEEHLSLIIKKAGKHLNEAELMLISKHMQKVRFYKRLQSFGYTLYLKPVKLYKESDGSTRRKANCDVDMTFHIMKEMDNFDNALILSGDGDFLPVLKHLVQNKKRVIILARGPRTAIEIRKFAGSNFKDFVTLGNLIRYDN